MDRLNLILSDTPTAFELICVKFLRTSLCQLKLSLTWLFGRQRLRDPASAGLTLPLNARGTVMSVYTFYPYRPDGSAGAFLTRDIASDDAAQSVAVKVLLDHPSCTYVEAWHDDRLVLREVLQQVAVMPGGA